jgi:hypothetical protein
MEYPKLDPKFFLKSRTVIGTLILLANLVAGLIWGDAAVAVSEEQTNIILAGFDKLAEVVGFGLIAWGTFSSSRSTLTLTPDAKM